MSWREAIEAWLGTDLYIDLGTANTLVVDRDEGLIVNEPSVIAYKVMADGRRRIVAVGSEAKLRLGKTPGHLTARRPLRAGVVSDLDATEAMLRHFIMLARRSKKGWRALGRPRVLMSLPYGVSDVEKKAVRECGLLAGAREVLLMDEPMAAAIGARLPVRQARGSMVIDIGGGTTEAAVMALCGIVACEAVRVGGDAFDEAIVEFMRRRYNLLIGEPSAERLKLQIGTADLGANESNPEAQAEVRGLDATSGLPRSLEVSAAEIHEALQPKLELILQAARRVLERTPPELLADLLAEGVVLAGGGALLRGLPERMSRELALPVRRAPDPLLAIAEGGAEGLRDPELLERVSFV